jgi:hypothetical protein
MFAASRARRRVSRSAPYLARYGDDGGPAGVAAPGRFRHEGDAGQVAQGLAHFALYGLYHQGWIEVPGGALAVDMFGPNQCDKLLLEGVHLGTERPPTCL